MKTSKTGETMKTAKICLIMLIPLYFINCKPSTESLKLMNEAKETFGVIPAAMPGAENDSAERVELGKTLYFDKALSVDDTISCNSCHNLENSGNGTDNAMVSTGVDGQKGGRNSPTVLNAGFHVAQFWDGRAADLKEQAKGPILNPIEMGMPDANAVIAKVKTNKKYLGLFKKAFPDAEESITYDNLAEAIAAFERTLITKDRFDDFINGNARALTPDEQTGLTHFMEKGCSSCHNGNLIGGNSYRKLGLANEYTTTDVGRFEVTKATEDKFVFKVPSLRNIANTGPYFHDGSIKTLEDAVKKMGWHQLDLKLSDEETSKIVLFLKALSAK